MAPGRVLIICKSVHHRNTASVARAMADVMQATVVAPDNVPPDCLTNYDLIGLGSGIYHGRFHPALVDWVRGLPTDRSGMRRAFVFSTAGLSSLWPLWHRPLTAALARKGFSVVGEFHCRGFDTYGPLWLFGGINRGHPDQRDLAHAADFGREMMAVLQSKLETRLGLKPAGATACAQ